MEETTPPLNMSNATRPISSLALCAAEMLEGIELDKGWKVIAKVPKGPTSTGGHFSVPYYVERGKMAANNETNDRQVVPRWRTFREALASNELASDTLPRTQAVDGSEFLREKEAAWQENRAMPFAVDLVSAATVLGITPAANQAAEHILANTSATSNVAQKLARGVLGIKEARPLLSLFDTRMQVIQGVKQLKQTRIHQPRNAFVWVDLARMYVLLGQNDQARKALNIALKLAPTERFVLRCTARFLHHIQEREEAVELLRKNSRTPTDTWLVAAEIAASCAARRTPRFAKRGLQLLKSGVLPFHTSELASALGSLEMDSGNNRAANKLFRESLRQPTDNALAQVVWASKRTGIQLVNTEMLEQGKANEALTWSDFHRGNWSRVIVEAEKWAQEEGFSARPLLLSSSTAASFLDEPKLAEEIARRGLVTNPGHPALVNNLAFSLILQGKPKEGLVALEKANTRTLSTPEAVCLQATQGMACFRLGNEIEGRRHYGAAIETAKGPENEWLRIVAALYLASERALRGDNEGFKDFKRAYEAARKLQQTHIPALAEHLARGVERSAERFGVQTQIMRKRRPEIQTGQLL